MSDKECIYREDAIAAILEYAEQPEPGWVTGPYAVAAIKTKELPAAPVREVVTCGECIYRGGDVPGQPNIICMNMKDDDFCSYGRKRADMRAEEGGTT